MKLKGYSKTRFLALKECLNSISFYWCTSQNHRLFRRPIWFGNIDFRSRSKRQFSKRYIETWRRLCLRGWCCSKNRSFTNECNQEPNVKRHLDFELHMSKSTAVLHKNGSLWMAPKHFIRRHSNIWTIERNGWTTSKCTLGLRSMRHWNGIMLNVLRYGWLDETNSKQMIWTSSLTNLHCWNHTWKIHQIRFVI